MGGQESHRLRLAHRQRPAKQRRAEIPRLPPRPDCRLFLSTDSGGIGLNLQNASVVINCDLPWNPAKLEQRIARAWRKNQLRPVTVVNLVAENTIEHGMLASLSQKMELAQGVLDGMGDLANIKLKSGRQAFLKRLAQVMSSVPAEGASAKTPPADPAAHFASRAKAVLGNRLTHCDETWVPGSPTPILMVVLQGNAERPRVEAL
jgi:superfamily II DNA/RNA helicase